MTKTACGRAGFSLLHFVTAALLGNGKGVQFERLCRFIIIHATFVSLQ